jgi:hypothetical protein
MFRVEMHGYEEMQEHLRRMRDGLERAPRRVVEDGAQAIVARERAEVPRRTGRLAEGLGYRVRSLGSSAEARFTSDADYTPFVVQGTAAHEIEAKTGHALFWPGAAHPVAFVHHPGTRPDDFPTRAMDRAERDIDRILDVVGEEIVEGRA